MLDLLDSAFSYFVGNQLSMARGYAVESEVAVIKTNGEVSPNVELVHERKTDCSLSNHVPEKLETYLRKSEEPAEV